MRKKCEIYMGKSNLPYTVHKGQNDLAKEKRQLSDVTSVLHL